MSARGFLDRVSDEMRKGLAYGSPIELVVLPREFESIIFAGCVRENIGTDEYEFDGYTAKVHGVPVLYSDRMPKGQCWFRYRGQKE